MIHLFNSWNPNSTMNIVMVVFLRVHCLPDIRIQGRFILEQFSLIISLKIREFSFCCFCFFLQRFQWYTGWFFFLIFACFPYLSFYFWPLKLFYSANSNTFHLCLISIIYFLYYILHSVSWIELFEFSSLSLFWF